MALTEPRASLQGHCGGLNSPTLRWPPMSFVGPMLLFSSLGQRLPAPFPASQLHLPSLHPKGKPLKEDSPPPTAMALPKRPLAHFPTPFKSCLTMDHVSQEQECQTKGAGEGISKRRRKERCSHFQRTSLHSTVQPLSPAFPSGCYWQPGNHIFLDPDIIIIINIGYLSHFWVSRSLKFFHIHYSFSMNTGKTRGGRSVCVGGWVGKHRELLPLFNRWKN